MTISKLMMVMMMVAMVALTTGCKQQPSPSTGYDDVRSIQQVSNTQQQVQPAQIPQGMQPQAYAPNGQPIYIQMNQQKTVGERFLDFFTNLATGVASGAISGYIQGQIMSNMF